MLPPTESIEEAPLVAVLSLARHQDLSQYLTLVAQLDTPSTYLP